MRRRWKHVLVLALLVPLVSGCTGSITAVTARGTAVAGGCWPDGVVQPATPTVDATAGGASGASYPVCTPVPGQPTRPATATRTLTPIPANTAQALVNVLEGATEIGDQPGYASARVLAVHPTRGTAAVGWISWAANRLDDGHDGQVWVRVQHASGIWSPLQTVNLRPVKKFFGGLGLAITPDNTIHAVFGAGGIDGDNGLYEAHSTDDGTTWSDPAPVGITGAAPPAADVAPTATTTRTPTPAATATSGPTPTVVASSTDFAPVGTIDGGALALRADDAGGLHLLALTAAGGYHLSYSYRAPGGRGWQTTDRLQGGAQYGGQLAVVSLPDGQVRRVVLVKDGSDGARITLYRSDDGQHWQGQQMHTKRYLANENVVATSVLAVPRGDSALIAVAWSQYAAGGVYAQVSLDGGETWSDEEQIAQHERGGALFDSSGTGLRAGFEPSLVYDAVTDQLAASWVELDLGPRPILGRTLLAARPLTGELPTTDTPWHYAIIPDDTSGDEPPALSVQGLRGALVGSPTGRTHWLLTLDERNAQYRLVARPVNLTALLAPDPS